MDPSCSQSECDIYEGGNQAPYDINAEIKTENVPIIEKPVTSQNNGRQPIDDIEREDFDEENRLLKHCSGMIVGDKIATAAAHYSGNLSSANSSLASSSETISNLSNLITNDFSLPGCSKDGDDSNTTIKNMIHSRKYVVHEPKEDFMQKLLNSNTQEKKDFPKGKLYKGDKMDCENDEGCDTNSVGGPSGRTSSNASSIGSSSSDSTKEFTVPSTSNAEKLLGLDDSRKNEPGSSKSSVRTCYLCCNKFEVRYCDFANESLFYFCRTTTIVMGMMILTTRSPRSRGARACLLTRYVIRVKNVNTR